MNQIVKPNIPAQQQSNTMIDCLSLVQKASGDPLRLNILRLLSHDSFAVQELCELLDLKQSSMSHHLKVLQTAGLVSKRREGNTLFYRRNSQHELGTIQQFIIALHKTVDQLPLDNNLQLRLEELNQQRAASSAIFFEKHSEQFKQQQEQVASYELYSEQVVKLLPQQITDTCLEIGPGDGQFLTELSPRFNQIIALDNSPAMLELAKQTAQQHKLNNIQFIHGDTQHKQLKPSSVNSIIVNMVLHHTPSPAQVIQELANLLAADGQLIITELREHNQSWVQEACGDIWLGIDPADISEWTAEVGLQEQRNIYLNQLNGFGVQIREFIKPRTLTKTLP